MTKRILVDAVHPEEIRVAVADDSRLVEFDFESVEKRQIKSNIYLGKITRVEPSLQAAFVEYGGNRQGFLPFSEIHFDYFQIPIEDKEKLHKTMEAERRREEQRQQEMETRESRRAARGNSAPVESNAQPEQLPEDIGNVVAAEPVQDIQPVGNEISEDRPARGDRGGRRERGGRGDRDRSDRGERGDRGGRRERGGRGDRDRSDRGDRGDRRDRGGRGERRERGGRDDRGGRRREPYFDTTNFVIPEPFTEADLQDLIRAEHLAKYFTYEIMGPEYFNEKYGNKQAAQTEQTEQAQPAEQAAPAAPSVAEAVQEPVSTIQFAPQPEASAQPEHEEVLQGEIMDAAEMSDDMDDDMDDAPSERTMSRMEFYKQYKIQEVIKRNQIVLIQIVKEERGSKGASLTTYLALAGRYCVFMPNTDKGGGVSRRISSFSERKRIRDVIRQINTPYGTSVIIRTAGMEREFDDIKKDYDYLLSLWDNIRKQTLESSAPALIYEESDIVKRSLRDMLKGDVSEVYIEGEETFKSATKFMELIGSNQLSMLKQYSGKMPIFQKYRIEERLDELYEPEIKLESGGSIVIAPTEALVAIDVNSGKATKERNVEDTALRTNIEAAREIARQLRLRDLAGLIVIDFIDMKEVRNRKAVERELKEALKADRAKIQIGRISLFGLLEMSRQRLRSSIVESSSGRCPMCSGMGVTRTTESLTLKVIRALEAEAGKKVVKEVYLQVSQAIAHNIDEHRKAEVQAMEKKNEVKITIEVDPMMLPNQFEISTQKIPGQERPRSKKKGGGKHQRPRQDVAVNATIPTESEIDADVDEQLSAWQSEVADVERIASRKFDERAPRSAEDDVPGPGNGGEQPRRERSGDRNGGDRNRGGRNRGKRGGRNRRGGGQGGQGGHGGQGGGGRRYNNANFDGNSFGNENTEYPQNNFVPESESRVERFNEYQDKREGGEATKPAAAPTTKQAPSKLVGLWKKITN